MDPKEKKVKEEELNVEETLNNAEEQPQDAGCRRWKSTFGLSDSLSYPHRS